MMEATEQMLAELGVPLENIHTERFGSKQKSHVKAVELEVSDIATAAQKGAAVTFKTSEISTQLTLDETVLDASERVGVNIESSCRVGACGMCSVKLLSGQVTMEVEDGLAPDDKAAGMILACQARPKNDIEVEA